MKRIFKLCTVWQHFDTVSNLMDGGWILDPTIYGGKPLRLENAVVYHLVKYAPGEEPEDQSQMDDVIIHRRLV